MTRATLPYFNQTLDGKGIEGLVSYSNRLTNYWMLPTFMLILYGLAIYVWSKTEWKLGSGVIYISTLFFILSWIPQTFTIMQQMVIFIFFIGIIVGIVMTFIENAKT